MRNWINLFEMTAPEARSVFRDLGVDLTNIDPVGLKTQYRRLMMQHHPDKGGDLEVAKKLSAAYNTIKDNPSGAQSTQFDDRTRGTWYEQPPRDHKPEPKSASYSMDHPQFTHIDYVKWYFEQRTQGKPSQEWNVMNFDGTFFRGWLTVRGNYDLFKDMANVMRLWDRHYHCRAVLAATTNMLKNGTIAVIDIDDYLIDPFVTLKFDSFNLNPSNDQQFQRKLPDILTAIEDGTFVSQDQM